MKKIETVICPQNWDAARAALGTVGAAATLREVKTFGRRPARREIFRGHSYARDTTAELELTVIVQDEALEAVLAALSKSVGDAEIVVTPIECVFRGAEASRVREVAPQRVPVAARPAPLPAFIPAVARA